MIHSHLDQPPTLAWLDGRDLIPAVVWHDPALASGFDPTDSYVETAGAVRIFKFLECALVAAWGTTR